MRKRLIAFYRKYAPQKLSSVDSVLESYKDREEQLFETLVKKYGPEPPTDIANKGQGTDRPNDSNVIPTGALGLQACEAFRKRLVAFYTKYTPAKLEIVEDVLKKYEGQEEQLFQVLVKKYGAEPCDESTTRNANNQENNRDSTAAQRKTEPDNEKETSQTKSCNRYSKFQQDALSGLPFVDVPEENAALFTTLRQCAILYFSECFYYCVRPSNTQSRSHAGRATFVLLKAFTIVSASRWVVATSEHETIRCAPLGEVHAVHLVQSTDVLMATLPRTEMDANECCCGVLAQFAQPEPDLFVGFSSPQKQAEFYSFLVRKLLPHVLSHEKMARVRNSSRNVHEVDELTPQLEVPWNYRPLPLCIPLRPVEGQKAPDAKERDYFNFLIPAPAKLVWPIAETPEKEKKYFEDFYSPLIGAAIRWLSDCDLPITLISDPTLLFSTPNQCSQLPTPVTTIKEDDCIGFLSATDLYFCARGQQVIRCVPVTLVQRVLVVLPDLKLAPPSIKATATSELLPAPRGNDDNCTKNGNKSRTEPLFVILCMARPPHQQHDICCRFLCVDLAEDFIESLLAVHNECVPESESSPGSSLKVECLPLPRLLRNGPEKDDAQLCLQQCVFVPPTDYLLSVAPLPRHPSLPNVKARLLRFLEHYDAQKALLCDEWLAKLSRASADDGNYREAVEAFFSKLVQQYGPEPPYLQAEVKNTCNGPVPVEDDTHGEQERENLKNSVLRERLMRFCRRYAPERIDSVDMLLFQYRDQEDLLFAQLTAAYGPEPAPEHPVAATDYRSRLLRFCSLYRPDMVSQVDGLLEKYKGSEENLMKNLRDKYGPEPPPLNYRLRLQNYIRRYFPEQIEKLDEVLEQNRTKEEEMFIRLAAKYGPEPPYPLEPFRLRLIRFCHKYVPEKLQFVDSVLAENKGQEEQLLEKLISKYGLEPPPVKTEAQRQEDRLIRFLGKYEPSKIPHAHLIIAPYRGREEALFEDLVAMYGSEPASDDPPESIATEVYELIDMTSELPFAEIPLQVRVLFPSLSDRAIFWFDAVSLWEPPNPVAPRYAFFTSTHFYVCASDRVYLRCFPIRMVQKIYINTRRPIRETKCAALLKLFPAEHDVFLIFDSDAAAKLMLWTFLEVVHRYHFGAEIRGIAVETLSSVGIDAQCAAPPLFVTKFFPIPAKKEMAVRWLKKGAQYKKHKSRIAEEEQESNSSNWAAADGVSTALPHTEPWSERISMLSKQQEVRRPPLGLTRNEVFGSIPKTEVKSMVSLEFGERETSLLARSLGADSRSVSHYDFPTSRHSTFGKGGAVPNPAAEGAPEAYWKNLRASVFVEHSAPHSALLDTEKWRHASALLCSPTKGQSETGLPVSYDGDEDDKMELFFFLEALELQQYFPLFHKRGLSLANLRAFKDEDFLHFGVPYKDERETLRTGIADEDLLLLMRQKVIREKRERERRKKKDVIPLPQGNPAFADASKDTSLSYPKFLALDASPIAQRTSGHPLLATPTKTQVTEDYGLRKCLSPLSTYRQICASSAEPGALPVSKEAAKDKQLEVGVVTDRIEPSNSNSKVEAAAVRAAHRSLDYIALHDSGIATQRVRGSRVLQTPKVPSAETSDPTSGGEIGMALPEKLQDFSTGHVHFILRKLGIDDGLWRHGFSSTNGAMLRRVAGREDLRKRFRTSLDEKGSSSTEGTDGIIRSAEEATDVLWDWLRHRRSIETRNLANAPLESLL